MTLDRIVNGLKAASARFARAERGNVAVMFAVTLPVLLTAVGAAIDYSRAANARSAMQAAVDATALMISKEASNLSPQDITTKATAYFKALYTHSEVGDVKFSATYTPNSGNGASVQVTATGSMQTDFMRLADIKDVPISVSSTTRWGNSRYRVALALDNTGSMASANKMNELKKAAATLIEDFAKMANTDADIYISIVPFSKDVNIGNNKKDETWVSWEYFGTCSQSSQKTKSACQAAGKTWTPTVSKNNWNGCVMDRDQSYDTTSDPLGNSPAGVMAPAEQYGNCPESMIGMTPVKSQKQALLDKITAMKPVGTTNQSIGAFWAWMTLQASGPFTAPAKDANYAYHDVLILLTDGLNTENRWDSNCGGWWGCSHEPEVDKRQELLCTNLKKTNTMVFAVQVATDNDPVSTVTKNCASRSDYFSFITKASDMTVTFENFFEKLSRLRVAS